MNIVLIGFMGTGKTVVGQALAKRLGRTFHDMDQLIEKEQGMPIAQLFSERGEAFFRKEENVLVKRLSAAGGAVIACGGGVAMDPENIRHLLRGGTLVLLTADIDTLVARLKNIKDRPLLAGSDIKQKITALLDERRSSYEKANIRVDTSGRSVEDIVDDIAGRIDPARRGAV